MPIGAAAAVLNVTAIDAGGSGFVTVYPCDAPRPVASSLNYVPGSTTPNEVIAKLSASGTICLFTLQPVDLVVDITGWVPSPSALAPLVPARLLDTRPGEPTIDHQFEGQGTRPAGSILELPIIGRGGVSSGAVAAVVNITAVNATTAGFVTVYPCDAPRPLASSLNYMPGIGVPERGHRQALCDRHDLPVHAAIRRSRRRHHRRTWLNAGLRACSVPARLLDTRPGEPTIDHQFEGQGIRPAGSILELPITGRGGVSSGAVAAVVNVTAVNATTAGFVTVYPCDAPRPLASSLNYTPGLASPNEVIARLSATGTICLFTLQSVDLVVDVTGFAT